MAADPKRRNQTVQYDGGTATGAAGLIEFLFGAQQLVWEGGTDSNLKRPYGSRQRSNAAAGEPMTVELLDGSTYTLRVTGTHKAFIAKLVKPAEDKIAQVYSERGTIYGRRPLPVA
jgi:hypothetical protein